MLLRIIGASIAAATTVVAASLVHNPKAQDLAPIDSTKFCVRKSITNLVVIYPILINQYFGSNQSVIINGDNVIDINNAPLFLSTLLTGTSTSATTATTTFTTTVTATTTKTAVPTVAPFILQFSVPAGTKRQAGNSFVGSSGSTASTCSLGAVYSISASGQLSSSQGFISTKPGVESQIFAPSQSLGSINTGFSISGNSLVWADASFANGKAQFCLLNSMVVIGFQGAIPSCTPLTLSILPAADCSNSLSTSSSSSQSVSASSTSSSSGVSKSSSSGSSSKTVSSSQSGSTSKTSSKAVVASSTKLSSTTATKSTSTASAAASTAGASTFITGMLTWHNLYRANNNASPLEWDATLAAYAQKTSDTCVFQHTGGPYGENLAEGSMTNPNYFVYLWYNEMMDYNFASPDSTKFSSWGHFSQVVWKSTTKVGCGFTTTCPMNYLVCEYGPAGNNLAADQLAANVAPAKSSTYAIPPQN